ncbi:winged helix-turn-helix domain-containing protein [Flavobacteriaceae bacterium TK19130]|nr:winged helix-turn-helix domain-containing protein [Thermobacterium salinum]
MRRRILFLSFLIGLITGGCQKKGTPLPNASQVKVTLREVGHQVLKSQEDTTSLVLPVKQLSSEAFSLQFENNLRVDPTILQNEIEAAIDRNGLPPNYLVEVLSCETGEVAYSYQRLRDSEKDIVPCGGRILPSDCYDIQLHFIATQTTGNEPLFFVLVFLVIAFVVFVFVSRYFTTPHEDHHEESLELGRFRFYPEQHKLVKESEEIPLSNKECELLTILSANPNQVVTREELTKRVWEDNGVIVGRSLDTYISKLRKKLQSDEGISILNVHGVGYKLIHN